MCLCKREPAQRTVPQYNNQGRDDDRSRDRVSLFLSSVSMYVRVHVCSGGRESVSQHREGSRVCIRNRSLSVRLSLHRARPKHVPLVLVRRSSSPAKASRTLSLFQATVGPHGASRQVVLMF